MKLAWTKNSLPFAVGLLDGVIHFLGGRGLAAEERAEEWDRGHGLVDGRGGDGVGARGWEGIKAGCSERIEGAKNGGEGWDAHEGSI